MHLPYYTGIYILRTADIRSAQALSAPPPAEKAAYTPAAVCINERQCLIHQRKPGRTAGHDSQENFEYPNGIFSEHWQKTREGYCSVIEANLIIEIEA